MNSQVKESFVKNNWDRPKEFKWEDNDCTVQCIRHAFNISYELAWRLCNAHGRPAKEGFPFVKDLIPALNVTPMPMFKGMTLNQALPFFSIADSRWIISVKGHVFAVVNGELCNHSPINYRDILGAWRILNV